ncbi:MAG TPA: DNA repair protein RecO [Sphingobacterium sp.]|nr:DNA repair protein RecO [Sphingobacterium sp.]
MIYKTRGIAIRTVKYKNSGLIAHIYTEEFGIQHYLVQGLHKTKSKIKDNLFRGLQLLDLEVYHRNTNKLERIREVSLAHLQHNNAHDISKSSILLFLNEVLYKVLKSQEADPALFKFIYNSILWLETKEKKYSDFHLVFLMKLSRLLGFGPTPSVSPHYFDLRLGIFTSWMPPHPDFSDGSLTAYFNQLITTNYQEVHTLGYSKTVRLQLLELLLKFYHLHIDNFGEVKSLNILKDVFE